MFVEPMNINDWQHIPEHGSFQKSKITVFPPNNDQEN